MDEIDKRIINALQGGFPLTERPYRDAGAALGVAEADLIGRLSGLIDQGKVSRFGPMYDAERMGGAFCLCAMAVPAERFEEVAARVNAHEEVAHNYERLHALNMWFVLAVERRDQVDRVAAEIESEVGLRVLTFPKLDEFFIGLKVEA